MIILDEHLDRCRGEVWCTRRSNVGRFWDERVFLNEGSSEIAYFLTKLRIFIFKSALILFNFCKILFFLHNFSRIGLLNFQFFQYATQALSWEEGGGI